jgi:hypothetical protein
MRMNIDTVWALETKSCGDFCTLAIYSARYRAMREAKKRIAEDPTVEVAVFRYKLDELVAFTRVPIK